MKLSLHLKHGFDLAVRLRGEDYFNSGRVWIGKKSTNRVAAVVHGSKKYSIALSFDQIGALNASCTCPYFVPSGDPCKHIWATILAAESRGSLQRLENAPDIARLGVGEKDNDEPQIYSGYPPSYDSRPPRRPAWQDLISRLNLHPTDLASRAPSVFSPGILRKIIYVIDVKSTLDLGGRGLVLEINQCRMHQDITSVGLRPLVLRTSEIPLLNSKEDSGILRTLMGAEDEAMPRYYYNRHCYPHRVLLHPSMWESLLPALCGTQRCYLRVAHDEDFQEANSDIFQLAWDEADPWELWLTMTLDKQAKNWGLRGVLRRSEQSMPLSEAQMVLAGGFVFAAGRVARFTDRRSIPWIQIFREHDFLRIPVKDQDTFLKQLYGLPEIPRIELPEPLRLEEAPGTPQPHLKLRPKSRPGFTNRLCAELSFRYDETIVPVKQAGRFLLLLPQRRLLCRDASAEQSAQELLCQLGFRPNPAYNASREGADFEIAPKLVPQVTRTLLDKGWRVEAEGKIVRRPGDFRLEISSGIDWFELRGSLDFDGRQVALPELLAGLSREDPMVRLDDGTLGMLPEEWLKKWGLFLQWGEAKDGHIRFKKNQVGVLDALLATQPEITCDETFARLRDQIGKFETLLPADEPPGFQGQLRSYQREGLGWLHFLRTFGLHGCLADDMGLGKTVQVLALLESRSALRRAHTAGKGVQGVPSCPGPSLAVVPKSVVYNWIAEAARFSPNARVLDHTGVGRLKPGDHFDEYDLILTTYGTLRRDVVEFKDIQFDYVILDEAQMIKNAGSDSAKAARLLRADHRLALSGTPIENHLGELWSLLEFLNPGMLGRASVFHRSFSRDCTLEESTRALLTRALRPFLLRRTKGQVAKDLPEKSEQTIYCDMGTEQRKLYDQLRDHYRVSLLGRIAQEGINRSKIHILEALLRLRQAACHPWLIDKKKVEEPSIKLDLLLEQLEDLRDQRHKALVFSQFTSLLAIVRRRLDRQNIPYEYLDGATRDRQSRIERFQNDTECPFFLISLKAGGLGLNLTAAEYVFLLDPWWNPAVESQAIDRTHRIGQTRQVFAYRLICRNTVEEKVLELQKGKRDLAEAILTADNSLIRNLTREDLELLLA